MHASGRHQAQTARKRGFPTKKAGLDWLADQQAGRPQGRLHRAEQAASSASTAPRPSTGCGSARRRRRRYRKNWRLHVEPYPLAQVPLHADRSAHHRALPGARDSPGRKDHKAGEGLSPRTVRYLHTIIHKVLGQAVKDGLITRNPADAATPPTAREARGAGDAPLDAAQLAAFLGGPRASSQNYPLWHVLAMTGMRRGECSRSAGATSTSRRERSASAVRPAWSGIAGEGAAIHEGDTKSGKPRVIDLDGDTVAVIRAHRKARGAMALQLSRRMTRWCSATSRAPPKPGARLAPVRPRCRALRPGARRSGSTT